jgi:hypothetical protein
MIKAIRCAAAGPGDQADLVRSFMPAEQHTQVFETLQWTDSFLIDR